jgi:hypothetical protein
VNENNTGVNYDVLLAEGDSKASDFGRIRNRLNQRCNAALLTVCYTEHEMYPNLTIKRRPEKLGNREDY